MIIMSAQAPSSGGTAAALRAPEELDALFADPERLLAMSQAARGHAHPDAAARVAELVDAHAR